MPSKPKNALAEKENADKRSSLANYEKAVEAAKLKAVNLIDFSFKVQPDFFSFKKTDLNFCYLVNNTDTQYEEDFAVAFVDFEVYTKKSRRKLLSCKAQYAVIYDGFKNCEEKEVRQFVNRVSVFTCYPYFRSLFASMDWAAGTKLPPLPIHKEPIIPKKKMATKG